MVSCGEEIMQYSFSVMEMDSMRPLEIFTVRDGRTVPVTVSITLAFLKMYVLGGGRFQGLMRCSETILKIEFACE